MTPQEIIKDVLLKTQQKIDNNDCDECVHVSKDILSTKLQEIIERSKSPASSERIAKMSNLLEVAYQNIIESRRELESLYNSKEKDEQAGNRS